MTRPRSEGLTSREAEIMEALWRLGEATAEEIREVLAGDPHDSSVRTMLRVLESKGHVAHEARGKAYVYRAAVDRAGVQTTALGQLLARLFGGSAEELILRLIEDERLTPEQLDAIREAAARAPGRRRGKGGTTR